MDRQEAIQTLSKVGKISVSYAEDLYDSFFPKPVVPQYVADWYKEHKNNLASDTYYLIRYIVKIKATRQCLSNEDNWPHFNLNFKTHFTKSELEILGFEWVFDCPGIEVKEVE